MTHSQPIIFFGSDQYSTIVLEHLTAAGYQAHLVTDSPRPVGRKQTLTPSVAESYAVDHSIPLSYYPELPETIDPDTIGFTASFDHLLPESIITRFPRGIYNLHPSLLPQYRNVSPVQYAIALGDQETGITLFQISTGIDNGKIIAQVVEPILPTDTTPVLTSRLFHLGAQLVTDFLTNLSPAHHSVARQKPSEGWIFTHRLTRDSGYLDWPVLLKLIKNSPISPTDTANKLLSLRLSQPNTTNHVPSTILTDLIRALHPWPTVWSIAKTQKGDLRISLVPSHVPGTTHHVLIAGKPNPISWDDFKTYYIV